MTIIFCTKTDLLWKLNFETDEEFLRNNRSIFSEIKRPFVRWTYLYPFLLQIHPPHHHQRSVVMSRFSIENILKLFFKWWWWWWWHLYFKMTLFLFCVCLSVYLSWRCLLKKRMEETDFRFIWSVLVRMYVCASSIFLSFPFENFLLRKSDSDMFVAWVCSFCSSLRNSFVVVSRELLPFFSWFCFFFNDTREKSLFFLFLIYLNAQMMSSHLSKTSAEKKNENNVHCSFSSTFNDPYDFHVIE